MEEVDKELVKENNITKALNAHKNLCSRKKNCLKEKTWSFTRTFE